MKWLKNIFGGSDSKGETLVLGLPTIESWLQENNKDASFEERLQEIYNRFEGEAKELAEDVSSLNSAEPNVATPPKLLRAGLAARGELVKQMESMSQKLIPPKQKDIEAAAGHHWALVKGLERTVTTFGRAQRYVAALFPKNMERINSDLGNISRLLVELEAEIDKKRKANEEIWYSKELVVGLREMLSKIDELQDKIRDNEELLASAIATNSDREDKLKQLAESADGRMAVDLKKRLDEKTKELAQLESEMADLVAPLTKALARIMKQGSSERLILQHANVFEQLTTSPSSVQDQDISGSLKELRSHLAALGLKDKKKEKILEHIDHLILKKSLQIAKSRRANLEEEIRGLEAHLSQSIAESKQLKSVIQRDKKSIQTLQSVLNQSQVNLATLREKVGKDHSELEERLSKLAQKPVKVDLS